MAKRNENSLFFNGIVNGFENYIIHSDNRFTDSYRKGHALGKQARKDLSKIKADRSYKAGYYSSMSCTNISEELGEFCCARPSLEKIESWIKGWKDGKNKLQELVGNLFLSKGPNKIR